MVFIKKTENLFLRNYLFLRNILYQIFDLFYNLIITIYFLKIFLNLFQTNKFETHNFYFQKNDDWEIIIISNESNFLVSSIFIQLRIKPKQ